MKKYRTEKQFQTILDNMHNGNWSDAMQNCVDYGFYSNDLLNSLEALDYIEECSQEWCNIVSGFVALAEGAEKIRGAK